MIMISAALRRRLRKNLNLNMVIATTGNGMSLQDRNSILLKIMNPVQTG